MPPNSLVPRVVFPVWVPCGAFVWFLQRSTFWLFKALREWNITVCLCMLRLGGFVLVLRWLSRCVWQCETGRLVSWDWLHQSWTKMSMGGVICVNVFASQHQTHHRIKKSSAWPHSMAHRAGSSVKSRCHHSLLYNKGVPPPAAGTLRRRQVARMSYRSGHAFLEMMSGGGGSLELPQMQRFALRGLSVLKAADSLALNFSKCLWGDLSFSVASWLREDAN